MRPLQDWSFARVLLVSGAWVVFCLVVAVGWIVFQFRGFFAASSGSGGVGAVSVGVSELILAIPVVPPILLILVWLVRRWGSHSSAAV